jgi:hypothetical protein
MNSTVTWPSFSGLRRPAGQDTFQLQGWVRQAFTSAGSALTAPAPLEPVKHSLEQDQASTSLNWAVRPSEASEQTERIQRNLAAIKLLEEWLADESGYDEKVWPVVRKAIEENRASYRSRFSE